MYFKKNINADKNQKTLAEFAFGKPLDDSFGGQPLITSVKETNSKEQVLKDQYERVPELKDAKIAHSNKQEAFPHEWFSPKFLHPCPLAKMEGMIVKDKTDNTEWRIYHAAITIANDLNFVFDSHLQNPGCVFVAVRPSCSQEDIDSDDQFFIKLENTRYFIRKPSGDFESLTKSQLNELKPKSMHVEDVFNRKIIQSRDGSHKKRMPFEPTSLFLERPTVPKSVAQFNAFILKTQPSMAAAPTQNSDSITIPDDWGSHSDKGTVDLMKEADKAMKASAKVVGSPSDKDSKKKAKKDKEADSKKKKKSKESDKKSKGKDKDKKKKSKKSKDKEDDSDNEKEDATIEIGDSEEEEDEEESSEESSEESESESESEAESSSSSASETESKKGKKRKKSGKDKKSKKTNGKKQKTEKPKKGKKDSKKEKEKEKEESESESEKEDKAEAKEEAPQEAQATQADTEWTVNDALNQLNQAADANTKKKSQGKKKAKASKNADAEGSGADSSGGEEASKKDEEEKATKKKSKKARQWPKADQVVYVRDTLKNSLESKAKAIKEGQKLTNPLAGKSDEEMKLMLQNWFNFHVMFADSGYVKSIQSPFKNVPHRADWPEGYEFPTDVNNALKHYLSIDYFFLRNIKGLPSHDKKQPEAAKSAPTSMNF